VTSPPVSNGTENHSLSALYWKHSLSAADKLKGKSGTCLYLQFVHAWLPKFVRKIALTGPFWAEDYLMPSAIGPKVYPKCEIGRHSLSAGSFYFLRRPSS
jgi:hypothetical protein